MCPRREPHVRRACISSAMQYSVDNLSSLTLCSTHTLFVGDGDTGTNWIHGGMRHGGGTSKQSKQ